MIKKILALELAALVSFCACSNIKSANTEEYTRYAVVDREEKGVVTVFDDPDVYETKINFWHFYGNGYKENSHVKMTVNNNGTPENLEDDIVVDVQVEDFGI